MEIQNLRDHFDDELDFPADQEKVLDEMGQTEIDAPNSNESMTIADALDPIDEDSYETADELRETIMMNLPDEYVGRDNYSDRGPEGNQPSIDDSQEDEQESL